MRRVLILFSFATTLGFGVPAVQAMGFGKTASPTLLGQPLDFSASIHLGPDEVLGRECVSAVVLSGENRLGDDQIRISVQAGSEPDERTVRITTLRMLDEPVVTVNLTVGCGSHVSRKFVTFLDPPLLNLAQAGEVDVRPAQPQQFESQVAPLVAMLQPPRAATRQPAPHARARAHGADRKRNRTASGPRVARGVRLAAADQAPASGARRAPGAARSDGTAAATGAPHLRLEAASPTLAQAPVDAAGAVAPLAPEAIALQAAQEPTGEQLQTQLAQERERIQLLETGLAGLRSDAQATRQSVLALQARLRQAEGERYANPLVYVLGGLCALLAAATAFAWRRPRRAGLSSWWALTQQPPVAVPVAARAPVAAPIEDTIEDPPWIYQPPRFERPTAPGGVGAMGPTSIGGLEVTTVIDQSLLARMAAGDAPEAPRALHELSVEELIDLEQQAEFFVVLGQDEAAIHVLSGHLHGRAGVSPLPYFKLLEIYRRRGEEVAYARTAEAFRVRFGAFAPTWEAATGQGRTLEDYPQTVTRLQDLWALPAEAMRALDAWLFRRQPADDTFDFGAYRDLLFLYSIARELSELTSGDGVDLALPIDEPEVDLSLPNLIAPSQFAALYAHPGLPAALDLDISMSAPFDSASELRKAV